MDDKIKYTLIVYNEKEKYSTTYHGRKSIKEILKFVKKESCVIL